MKIEDNRKEYSRRFKDLGCGECLEYNGNFYMKCGNCMDGVNAVRLSTGDLTDFDNDESVLLVEAKLVIE